jgi:hypothetical protein
MKWYTTERRIQRKGRRWPIRNFCRPLKWTRLGPLAVSSADALGYNMPPLCGWSVVDSTGGSGSLSVRGDCL